MIEVLVSVGITAIAGTILTSIFLLSADSNQRNLASTEVTNQLNFVLETIGRLVRESSSIETEYAMQSSTLTLRMKDETKDPTIISFSDNMVTLKEGNNPVSSITNSKVKVDALTFVRESQGQGKDVVSVDLAMTFNTENPKFQLKRNLSSAIARVSAATFDSDLVPGSSYTYNIGQAGSPWQKLFMADGTASNPSYTFSSDTNTGLFRAGEDILGFSTNGSERMRITGDGVVGINRTSVDTNYKLDVNGFIKSVTTVDQNTVPSIYGSQTASVLQDGSANTGTDEIFDRPWVAVKFTATGAHNMRSFSIRIKTSAPLTNITSVIYGRIYSDNGGVPGSSIGSAQELRYGRLTTSYAETHFYSSVALSEGTSYWLVFQQSSAPTGGTIYLDRGSSGSSAYAFSANGTSWTVESGKTFWYKIYGRTFYGLYGVSANYHGVRGASTTQSGIYGSSNTSYGVFGESIMSSGTYGSSTYGYGVVGASTNGSGVLAQTNPTSTNSVATALTINRYTSGTAQNGIGAGIRFYLEDTAGNTSQESGLITSAFTNATDGQETSVMTFYTRSAGGALAERVRITGDGLEIKTGGIKFPDSSVQTTSAVFTKSFTSAELTKVDGGVQVIPHGLGEVPILITGQAKCVVAQCGYDVNDIVNYDFGADKDGARGTSMVLDSTNITIRFHSSGTYIPNKATTVNCQMGSANWRYIIRAFR